MISFVTLIFGLFILNNGIEEVIRGKAVSTIEIVFGVFFIAVSIGIYKLKKRAFWLMIIALVWGIVVSFLTIFSLGTDTPYGRTALGGIVVTFGIIILLQVWIGWYLYGKKVLFNE